MKKTLTNIWFLVTIPWRMLICIINVITAKAALKKFYGSDLDAKNFAKGIWETCNEWIYLPDGPSRWVKKIVVGSFYPIIKAASYE